MSPKLARLLMKSLFLVLVLSSFLLSLVNDSSPGQVVGTASVVLAIVSGLVSALVVFTSKVAKSGTKALVAIMLGVLFMLRLLAYILVWPVEAVVMWPSTFAILVLSLTIDSKPASRLGWFALVVGISICIGVSVGIGQTAVGVIQSQLLGGGDGSQTRESVYEGLIGESAEANAVGEIRVCSGETTIKYDTQFFLDYFATSLEALPRIPGQTNLGQGYSVIVLGQSISTIDGEEYRFFSVSYTNNSGNTVTGYVFEDSVVCP